MKDNQMVVNPDDYTWIMAMKGSNYQRSENNSKIGNTFATLAKLKNSVVFVLATSLIQKSM
jgi:hypothetical protein